MYYSNRVNIPLNDPYDGVVERRPFTSTEETESSVWNRLDSQENDEPDLRFKLMIRRRYDDLEDSEFSPRKRMKLTERFSQIGGNSSPAVDTSLQNVTFQLNNSGARNFSQANPGISRPMQYPSQVVFRTPMSSNIQSSNSRERSQRSATFYNQNDITDSVYSSLNNQTRTFESHSVGNNTSFPRSTSFGNENRPTSNVQYSSYTAPASSSYETAGGSYSGYKSNTFSESAWSAPNISGRFSSWNSNNVVIPRLSSNPTTNTSKPRFTGQKFNGYQSRQRSHDLVQVPIVKSTQPKPTPRTVQPRIAFGPRTAAAQSVTKISTKISTKPGVAQTRVRLLPPVRNVGGTQTVTRPVIPASTRPGVIPTSTRPKVIATTRPGVIPTSTRPKVIATARPGVIATSTRPKVIPTSARPKVMPTVSRAAPVQKARPRIEPPNGTTSTMVSTIKPTETAKPVAFKKTFRAIVLITGATPLVRKDESMIKTRLRKDAADAMFSDGDPLELASMELVYGRLVVECGNVGTFNWILNWSMDHRGEKVLAVNPVLAGDPLKIGVQVTKEQRAPGIHIVTKEINKANPGMLAEHWRIINEFVNDEGVLLEFSVQPAIVERIRRLDWKLKYQSSFVKVIDYRTKVQKAFYMKTKL